MKNLINQARQSIPNDYTTSLRQHTDSKSGVEYILRIAEKGTTKAIRVAFWFSPTDQKWLVTFIDKYKLPENQGLISEDLKSIEAFLDLAIMKMV